MIPEYLKQFPIPASQLPARLRSLLEPMGGNPQLQVAVTTRYDVDQYGPDREHVQMVMAVVPVAELGALTVLSEAADGVVSYSTPYAAELGELSEFKPSVSGHDYIVASWGDASFYNYSLAEKVWMALGLSARCLGGDQQKLIYDDLSRPEFAVAEGELSTEHHFSPKRNVHWTMSNAYLRRYLWMRGAYGVRVFFYEAMLPDSPDLRVLMAGKTQVLLEPEGSWYKLDIREHDGGLLIQLWATVVAVSPDLCPEEKADGLVWPDVTGAMTRDRANALVEIMPVYLDDTFLERYEQSGLFDSRPVNVYGLWHCSPSYRGQWGFSECVRVGRNLIKVPMRELYKPKPDREILHAYAHVLDPARVAAIDQDEEHIVSKTQRLVDQLLDLGDQLVALSAIVGMPRDPVEIVGFSRKELRSNGWLNYPELSRLAQVAPLAMTEQAFLSRCKSLHELWQRIPNGFLRSLTERAGHSRSAIKELQSLRLLQAVSNIVERLNADGEQTDAYGAEAEQADLTARNVALAPLFINNDLRIADAHGAGGVLRCLEALGFDAAGLNQGYGRALDHVFDRVIGAFSHLNMELAKLLER